MNLWTIVPGLTKMLYMIGKEWKALRESFGYPTIAFVSSFWCNSSIKGYFCLRY